MIEKIIEASKKIKEMNKKTLNLAKEIRNADLIYKDAYERELTYKMEKIKINKRIGAIDSGFLMKEMHGVDLIVYKTIGVIFEYRDGMLNTYSYHPSPFPNVNYEIEYGLDDKDVLFYPSLKRLKEEIKLAISLLDKVDILMLDGSIVPLVKDKPNEEGKTMELFDEIVGLYNELYKKSIEKEVLLLGIVKDTRSSRFVDLIKAKIKTTDINLLNYILKEGERTFVFKYSSNKKDHPILKHFQNFYFNVFYAKPSKNDGPLRIEFLQSKNSFDEIANLIYTLSSINKNYAYPSILIEADLRAMVNPDELDRFEKSLYLHTNLSINPLRGKKRPFR